MMLAYGLFVFGLHTLAYSEFQRQMAWRHPTASRVGERPTSQYVGPDFETITLPGTLHPGIAGARINLDILEAMADAGDAWPLIDGASGKIYGAYKIVRFEHTGSVHFADGTPRKIDFTLTLQREPDDAAQLGTIDAALLALI